MNKIFSTFVILRGYIGYALLFSCICNILSLALPIYSMQVLDRVLSSSSIETLIYLSIIIFAAIYCMNIISESRNGILEQIGNKAYKKLVDSVLYSTVKDSVNKNIGSEYMRDLLQIKNFISGQHLIAIIDAPWAIIFLLVIFYIHWICGMLILVSLIILTILAFINQKLTLNNLEKINEQESVINNKLNALSRNFESIISMGMMQNVFANYKNESEEVYKARSKAMKKVKFISNFTKVFRYLVQILITFISAILIIKGKMSSGGMIAVSMLAGKALGPFDLSPAIISSIAGVRKSYHKLVKILSNSEQKRISLPTPNGFVKFENVVYHVHDRLILKGVSFEIKPGEIIGIIGKSGSGKTTLIRLLAGILQQSRGSIKIDNADLSLWNNNELGKYIGYLPQNFELLPVSIKENICRMEPDAKDADIINAAKIANVHDLILTFENGYETIVSETSLNLSAGQRQRIALARCFYGSSKILILDEPNSNLDLEGEQALVSAILNAKSNQKTVIIVSHKPNILTITDKVMVIQDGELSTFDERDNVLKSLGFIK